MTPNRFGKYEVRKKLGQGGFGTVYLSYDPHLKRQVAIKTCTSSDPDLRRRFAREAELAADLVHPNITTVFDFGVEGGAPYLVQEFLPGEDLSAKISRRERISPQRKLRFLLEVAKGLEYAHSRGVVHRDIKPGNIRVLDDDRVKIMDFGIAKLLQAESQLTRTGMAIGTAGYLPPEQIQGRPVDQRADIFSFGVLAYELLTYRRPFRGDDISAVFFSILSHEPPPVEEILPKCPPELGELVRRCLAKEPVDRFESFGPLIAELEGILTATWQESEDPTVQAPASVLRSVLGTNRAARSVLVSGARTTLGDGFEQSSFLTGLRLRRMSLLWLGLSICAVAAILIGLWSLSNRLREIAPESSTDIQVAASEPSTSTASPEHAFETHRPPEVASRMPEKVGPTVQGSTSKRRRQTWETIAEAPRGGTVQGTVDTRNANANLADLHPHDDVVEISDAEAQPPTVRSPQPSRPVGQSPQPAPQISTSQTPELQPRNERPPRIDPARSEARRVLVILAGPADAGVDTAEGALLQELSDAGADPTSVGFQSASQREGLVTGTPSDLKALGRRYAADLVVTGRLQSEAEPSLARFFVGRAVIDLRIYDASTGRQLSAETVQVGGDGRQGKAGTSAMAARVAAAKEAGRVAAQRVVRAGRLARKESSPIEDRRERLTVALASSNHRIPVTPQPDGSVARSFYISSEQES
ncbi:MAG TPA: protein kinase [Thermoanaerobaculia bacterium]|nr:protein kinase [Thermoanaerobaculia bacterium]